MKSRSTVFSLAVLFFLLLFSGSLYAAEGLIQKVEFQKEDGKIESVLFHLNGPWLPKVFALKGDNPRVVFDFMETGLARSVPSSIDAKGAMVRKIRMGRHGSKTRVVIDLTVGGEFNFDQQFDESNNILTIHLFPADFPEKQDDEVVVEEVAATEPIKAVVVAEPEPKPEPKPELKPEPKAEPAQEAVKTVEKAENTATVESVIVPAEDDGPVPDALLFNVSFENTSNKGEMVLFKLNGFYPPTVSGKEEGTPLVICDFAGTRLGDEVVKEQIVHGEYVERVTVQQLENSELIRVTVELVPSKNYDLQQVFFKEDNLFVIIVNSYDSSDDKTN
jgi:AMIN domain-containing protein